MSICTTVRLMYLTVHVLHPMTDPDDARRGKPVLAICLRVSTGAACALPILGCPHS